MTKVSYQQQGSVAVVQIERPKVRNAVDRESAAALVDCFERFEADAQASVAVLTGAGGHFCAGADLKAMSEGNGNRLEPEGSGPMGPSRMLLSKPVIAAVEGHAVAGGLELAIWCDLRVAAKNAIFGVYCRRFGVPLIDGGTVRLPRLIGQSRALDMILTGRAVHAPEALEIGLVNRISEPGQALDTAIELAKTIAKFPQQCLKADRLSALTQWGLNEQEAMKREFKGGMKVVESGETAEGAQRFRDGSGRGGRFE